MNGIVRGHGRPVVNVEAVRFEKGRGHLGQAVHVALVDELVVGRVGAALVDAEQVLVGHVWVGPG